MEYTIYTDGGVYNNQFPLKRKAYLSLKTYDDGGNLIHHHKEKRLPYGTTNNQCEYMAVEAALDNDRNGINDLTIAPTNLIIYSDSQLVVKQLAGEYKVRSENIKPLYTRVKEKFENYPIPVQLQWVSRDITVEKLGH